MDYCYFNVVGLQLKVWWLCIPGALEGLSQNKYKNYIIFTHKDDSWFKLFKSTYLKVSLKGVQIRVALN